MISPCGVYLAAPKAEVGRARALAALVGTIPGLSVVSTWHGSYEDGAADPDDRGVARSVLDKNLADLGQARVVVALLSDSAGRETYVEIGRALAAGLFVVLSGERGGLPLSQLDGMVVATDAEALRVLRDFSAFREACGGGKEMIQGQCKTCKGHGTVQKEPAATCADTELWHDGSTVRCGLSAGHGSREHVEKGGRRSWTRHSTSEVVEQQLPLHDADRDDKLKSILILLSPHTMADDALEAARRAASSLDDSAKAQEALARECNALHGLLATANREYNALHVRVGRLASWFQAEMVAYARDPGDTGLARFRAAQRSLQKFDEVMGKKAAP